jgi:hypothetical protein
VVLERDELKFGRTPNRGRPCESVWSRLIGPMESV